MLQTKDPGVVKYIFHSKDFYVQKCTLKWILVKEAHFWMCLDVFMCLNVRE